MHKILFYNKFIICLYMLQALLCSSSGGQIILYSIWYRHTETGEWSKITKIQFYIYIYKYIFIELYFSNFRPLTCFSVLIPDAV